MSDMRDILKRALPQADEAALDRFEIYQRLLAEWNEVNQEPCGIHLVMKNISVTLTEVVYED